MASAPQPDQPTTLQEHAGKAEQMAQELSTYPDGKRKSELLQIRKSNPTLAALVQDSLRQLRQQTDTQGGSQLRQQMGKAAAAWRPERGGPLSSFMRPRNGGHPRPLSKK